MARHALYRMGVKPLKFRGCFATYEEALAAVPKGRLAGYDNDAIADSSFEGMCNIHLWDYPVLFWLSRLGAGGCNVLDLGGHQGTKFRAFKRHLNLGKGGRWIVYDVPAVLRAGREKAARDGLSGLCFIDDVAAAPSVEIALASGLLQYLDVPFSTLLKRLSRLPNHLVLNKVAVRGGPTVVTLENFGQAEVPYQIRNYDQFVGELHDLGYTVIDEWRIPAFSHIIPTHVRLGLSTSVGFYCERRA